MMTRSRWLALAALAPVLALGVAPAGGAAHAPAAAVAGLNDEIQQVWDGLRPAAESRLRAEATARLDGLEVKQGHTKLTVRRLRSIRLDLATAPGFTDVSTDRLALAVPHAGAWAVRIKAEVRVEQRVPIIGKIRSTFPIELKVKDIAVTAAVDLDDADPGRPVVRAAHAPAVAFEVSLDSPNFLYGLLFRALSPVGDRLAHVAVDDALKSLAPNLAALAGLPGPVPGDGAAPYADSGAPTPFLEVARKVDRKLRDHHMPHGLVMRVQSDQAAPAESWLAAYGPGGPGFGGTPARWFGYGDSAIWTGHYLASQACRAAATGDPDALDNVRYALAGIGRLFDVNGGTGLPARAVAPLSSPVGQDIARRGAFRQAQIGAETWVSWVSDAGMSRDQLSGLFFGLALAHDLVPDPAVRAECAARITQMLDYLVAHRWWVDEDRAAFTARPGGAFPTFWLGNDLQRVTWLLIGRRVAPGRYDAELARFGPLAAVQWLGTWMSTFNEEHYYKFNLESIAFFHFFRLETDPTRWQDMARAWRVLRRYVGHHRNPHLDTIAVSAEPALLATLGPSCRESVRRYLERNHREVAPATVDLSGVQWTTFTVPYFDSKTGTAGSKTVTLPTEPLDPALQDLTGFFSWQRSPFRPMQAGTGDAKSEVTGLDIVLPYWMGRVYGVFP